jgi:chromosome segregation ATPase
VEEKSSEIEKLRKTVAELDASLSKTRLENEESKAAVLKAHEARVEKLRQEAGRQVKAEIQKVEEKSSEIEKLRKTVAELDAALCTTRLENEENKAAALKANEAKVKELCQEHEDQIEKERLEAAKAFSLVAEEKDRLTSELDALNEALTNEREAHDATKTRHGEEIESLTKQKQDLVAALVQMKESVKTERKARDAQQAETRQEHETKIKELKDVLEKERKLFEDKKKQLVESNNAACEREKELQDKVQSLESQLAKNKDKYLQSLENARNEHTAEIDEMLAQLAKNKDEYSKSLQKVRDEHTAEIDEMLEQLDIVEAEHNTKYTKLNDAVKQKEAIVSALGAQLAEATAKMTALQAEKEQDLADLAMAREEAELARAASDSLKKSLDRLRDDHKKALEEEAQRRQELCQTVKKGMILAAEEQFGKANEHYVNLKHEYDAIKEKLNKVELELKTSKRDLDRSRKEEASREVEMRAEIARLKACK